MKKINVPYAALAAQTLSMKNELMQAAEQVLTSGQYILGPSVTAFEGHFSRYCQTSFAAGVSNGTSALQLALRALGVGEGDEVITAPNSFIASASSIALIGARPVFAEVGNDMNLDPDSVAQAVTTRTKGIMPVHLTGRPAKMEAISVIAKKHKLFVLEDAAQAVGAKLKGRRVGSWGDAACFSLHPLKNLHVYGDGGAITTSDSVLHEFILKARNHGLRNREACDFWSTNSRLDELQAAFLNVQLKHLDVWTEKRRELAFRYNKALKPYATVPEEGKDEYCVYQTYMIQAEKRDALKNFLNENGVQATVHYAVPIPLQAAAKELGYTAADFPRTLKIVDRILSLPLYPEMTEEQQGHVIECIAEFYKGTKK